MAYDTMTDRERLRETYRATVYKTVALPLSYAGEVSCYQRLAASRIPSVSQPDLGRTYRASTAHRLGDSGEPMRRIVAGGWRWVARPPVIRRVFGKPHPFGYDPLFQSLAAEIYRLACEVGRLRRRELDHQRAEGSRARERPSEPATGHLPKAQPEPWHYLPELPEIDAPRELIRKRGSDMPYPTLHHHFHVHPDGDDLAQLNAKLGQILAVLSRQEIHMEDIDTSLKNLADTADRFVTDEQAEEAEVVKLRGEKADLEAKLAAATDTTVIDATRAKLEEADQRLQALLNPPAPVTDPVPSADPVPATDSATAAEPAP